MADHPVHIDNVPHVVIEPPKPLPQRLKQYYVIAAFEDGPIKGKVGKVVRLTETEAVSYVSARFIVPLDVALRENRYPKKQEGLVEKAVEAVTGEELTETPKTPEPTKKSFLGNTLRDAIQVKKEETESVPESKSKIDLAKLAAIKSGGKK